MRCDAADTQLPTLSSSSLTVFICTLSPLVGSSAGAGHSNLRGHCGGEGRKAAVKAFLCRSLRTIGTRVVPIDHRGPLEASHFFLDDGIPLLLTK